MGKVTTRFMKVCSLHFKEDDFILPGFDRKLPKLKKMAVPSQNLPTKSIYQVAKYRQNPRVRINTAVETVPKFLKEPTNHMLECTDAVNLQLDYQPEAEKIAVDVLLQLGNASNCQDKPNVDKATQVKSGDIFVSFISVIKTDAKLSSLTGIPSFKMFNSIVELLTKKFPDCRIHKMSIEERLVLTFMKMKTGLRYVVLVALFTSVTSKTCKIIFEDMITKLALALKPVIKWPTLEECQENSPACFKNFQNVRVVLDCTEFFIQRSALLKFQVMTYSHYKGGHTVKFMTGVSPAGTITFVSNGYGGKSSDNAIFEESGIINMLEMGRDAVMVDKGFRIDKITDAYYIKLIRPPFLKKNKQLTKEQSRRNVEIARARVHIERTNQRIKVFEIFTKPLPVPLLDKVDEMFLVACAIVNLSHPILNDDKFLTS